MNSSVATPLIAALRSYDMPINIAPLTFRTAANATPHAHTAITTTITTYTITITTNIFSWGYATVGPAKQSQQRTPMLGVHQR